MFFSRAVDAHKDRCCEESALDRIDVGTYRDIILVVCVESWGSGHRFSADEWCTSFDFRSPDAFHCVSDRLEDLSELLLPSSFLCQFFDRRQVEDVPRRFFVSIMHDVRVVIEISDASQCHIAQGIMVRTVVSLRTEEPAWEIPVVSLVECHHIVVEEVCSASAAGSCKSCFCHDCITFNEIHSMVDQRCEDVEHFSENVIERSHRIGHSELHLSHVARLMESKHCWPRNRFGIVCGRDCEEVHPLGGPGNGTVRGVVGVHHHRHELSVAMTCHKAGRTGYGNLVFFKLVGIDSSKGISTVRIYDAITVCVHAAPFQTTGIVTGNVELSTGRAWQEHHHHE